MAGSLSVLEIEDGFGLPSRTSVNPSGIGDDCGLSALTDADEVVYIAPDAHFRGGV